MPPIECLEELQSIESNILNHFKVYCESKKIQYFLSSGTLLGAVKYGGFIPWDDDIDVFVPREDYDRLVREYKNGEDFELLSTEREEKWTLPYAKLCDLHTFKDEGIDDVKVGLNIDIFPLDSFAKGRKSSEFLATLKYLYAVFLSDIKMDNPVGRNKLVTTAKHIYLFLIKLFGKKFFLNALLKNSGNLKTGYVGRACWPMYKKREVIPAAVFDDTVEITFEGEKYSAPVGYDIYLSSLYGDYKNDLPQEQQISHHVFNAYRK